MAFSITKTIASAASAGLMLGALSACGNGGQAPDAKSPAGGGGDPAAAAAGAAAWAKADALTTKAKHAATSERRGLNRRMFMVGTAADEHNRCRA